MLQILSPAIERSHGEGWQKCESEQAVPYSALQRFAVAEIGFGRTAPTIR